MSSGKLPKSQQLAEARTEFVRAVETDLPALPKHIVAIGASAGGLDPLQVFFDVMSSDSGLAFVVVQHLSPDYKSLMVELLARHTDIPIHRVTDQMEVEANAIYLIPAGKEMIISNHKLLLSDRDEGSHLHLPIDTFMKSLAEEKGEDAIAIILSGSGSDGCRGAEAIRKAGGFVLVQAPETAKFDGMPNAAINNKSADLVISPSDMPEILKRHIGGERLRTKGQVDPVTILDPLRQILEMLRKRFGPDFGYYKDSTVGRRIKRRAGLKRIPELIDYVQFLKDTPDELEALYHDLLIGVTAFFRDKEAFATLEQLVIPQLAMEMGEDRPLRIWVPACATGEEAYSIAILFAEYADRHKLHFNLKIFATDVHDGSLELASEGFYKDEMLGGVSNDRRDEFFDKHLGGYKISNRIRRCVVFSKHNILRDPPFTKMDLISCRNLLIYFTDIAQRKVLSLFHFALRRGGFLFLGSSETVSKLESELEAVDSKQRIYTKTRDVRLPDAIQLLPVSTGREIHPGGLHVGDPRLKAQQTRQVQAGYDLLLKQYAPPSLMVNAEGEILHVFGNASEFMRLPGPGLISTRAVDLVRSEFSLLIGPALERTLRHGIRTVTQEVKIATTALPQSSQFADQRGEVSVSISIEPLKSSGEPRPYFALAQFHVEKPEQTKDLIALPPLADAGYIDDEAVQQRIIEMEHQLKTTEENLQTTIEELETSNEELQAANEELQASNEELQSTNEELHSVNEELHTVSAEHETKISELSQVNQDVDNMLRSTDIGTVFVDGQMRIRKFTQAAAKILNLVEHDHNRMIDHVTYRFSDKDFYSLVKEACHAGRSFEREVEVEDYGWFLLRIRPYNQDGRRRDGAVITFVDINEQRRTREEALIARERIESFLNAASDWLWETDKRHRVTYVTDGIQQLGIKPDDAITKPFFEIFSGDPVKDKDWRGQMAAMNAHTPFRTFETTVALADDRLINVTVNGTPRFDSNDEFIGFRGTTQDITERNEADMRLSVAEARYRSMYNSAPVLMHSTDDSGYIVSVSDFWLQRMGYERGDVIGREAAQFYANPSAGSADFVLSELSDHRRVDAYACTLRTQAGEEFEALLWALAEYDNHGQINRTLEVVADVSDLRRTAADLALKNAELVETNQELERFSYVASNDLRSPLRSCNVILQHLVSDIEDHVDPSICDQFRLINERLVQMEAMLGSLLDYAQAGRNDLALERLKLEDVLNEALQLINPPVGMFIEIDVGNTMIECPPSVAGHVFRNLIQNAIQHHDRTDGHIKITARPNNHGIEVDIHDDGPGIDEAYHQKIFELFGCVNESGGGDGLGLALVRRAMSKTGGDISVISTGDERGALFRLFWPATGSSGG